MLKTCQFFSETIQLHLTWPVCCFAFSPWDCIWYSFTINFSGFTFTCKIIFSMCWSKASHLLQLHFYLGFSKTVLFIMYISSVSTAIRQQVVPYHLFADVTATILQVHQHSSLHTHKKRGRACTADIKSWMTDNMLQWNDPRTKKLLILDLSSWILLCLYWSRLASVLSHFPAVPEILSS